MKNTTTIATIMAEVKELATRLELDLPTFAHEVGIKSLSKIRKDDAMQLLSVLKAIEEEQTNTEEEVTMKQVATAQEQTQTTTQEMTQMEKMMVVVSQLVEATTTNQNAIVSMQNKFDALLAIMDNKQPEAVVVEAPAAPVATQESAVQEAPKQEVEQVKTEEEVLEETINENIKKMEAIRADKSMPLSQKVALLSKIQTENMEKRTWLNNLRGISQAGRQHTDDGIEMVRKGLHTVNDLVYGAVKKGIDLTSDGVKAANHYTWNGIDYVIDVIDGKPVFVEKAKA